METTGRQRILFRTGSTELSDDDLLIMDALFDGGSLLKNLVQKWLGIQGNMPNHSLSNNELTETLKRWVKFRWLTWERKTYSFYSRPARAYDVISLTSTGGAIWEQERQPIWERYCTDGYRGNNPNRTMLTVIALSESTRNDFVRYIPEKVFRCSMHRLRDQGLLGWRNFESLYVSVLMIEQKNTCSFEEFEQQRTRETEREYNRTWWRTVCELQRFHPPEKQNCP